jgi:porin
MKFASRLGATILLWSATPLFAQDTLSDDGTAVVRPPYKSGYTRGARFGGPASIPAQLEEDDRAKAPVFRFPQVDAFLQPWFDGKRELNNSRDLEIGSHYVNVYQRLSDSLTDDQQAWSGIIRLAGTWLLAGENTEDTGTLVFKIENRHEIGSNISPSELAESAGYLGQTGPLFTDVDTVLVDLNWQQYFHDGRTSIIAGRYDPSDYMNVAGYANPWTSFQNLMVMLDASIAFPDASYGIGVGHWLTDQWAVGGSINDANGTIPDLGFFEGGSEFFTEAQLIWTPSREERLFKRVGLTVWNVDARGDLGIGRGDGVALTANWTIADRWMPFIRVGRSNGTASIYNESTTVGFIRYLAARSDLFGIGINRGDPSDETLRVQTTAEFFYRFQLSENLAITPSVQLLDDPALNPQHDRVWVFGLRVRLAL